MSEFDMLVASFLNDQVLPIVLFLLLTIFVFKRLLALKQKIFAWYNVKLYDDYTRLLARHKAELFASLDNFVSLDWNLRNLGLIRIVEIGVGQGGNFQYYPKNARVIAIDSCPDFTRYVEEQRTRLDIHLEKVVLGTGEDLDFISDNSVDVVVTTVYLCSVKRVEAVLSEIHRILAPGGKYFFLEHQIGQKGSWNYFAQEWGKSLWAFVFDGCHIHRDLIEAIRRSGFAQVECRHFTAQLRPFIQLFIGPHICGTATKSCLEMTSDFEWF